MEAAEKIKVYVVEYKAKVTWETKEQAESYAHHVRDNLYLEFDGDEDSEGFIGVDTEVKDVEEVEAYWVK